MTGARSRQTRLAALDPNRSVAGQVVNVVDVGNDRIRNMLKTCKVV
jgi:hypothetical protein